jgi:wyosine [tRNA(Phe)-imidazoG37] synthetase (radical SAM superfamily)
MSDIIVNKKNFYKLREKIASISPDEYLNFSVSPLNSISSRFEKHIKSFSTKGLNFSIDPELLKMLASIECAISDGINEYEILRMLGILTEDVFIGPESIHLDVVNYCNIKCIHCWFHSPLISNNENQRPNVLPFDKINDILSAAKRMKVADILLLGCGEPFLHPEIKAIINLFKKYNFRLTLFTNGTLLDDDLINSLAIAGDSRGNFFPTGDNCGRLYFSISAGDAETYSRIHAGATSDVFTRTMNNITKLSKVLKLKCKMPPRIILLHVIHKMNFCNIHKMFHSALESGADELWLQLTEYTPETKHLILNKEDIEAVKAQILLVTKLARIKKLHVNSNINFQLDNVNPETGNWSENLYSKQGCYIGWDFMRVWHNGDISFCCPPKIMGNIFKTDIESVWNSQHYSTCRVAAKYFNKKNNALTIDNKPLLDDQCNLCPNYVATVRRNELLKKSQLIKYL